MMPKLRRKVWWPQQVAASVRGLLQADTIFEIEKGNGTARSEIGIETR